MYIIFSVSSGSNIFICFAWKEMIKRNKEWGNITKSMIEKNWATC